MGLATPLLLPRATSWRRSTSLGGLAPIVLMMAPSGGFIDLKTSAASNDLQAEAVSGCRERALVECERHRIRYP